MLVISRKGSLSRKGSPGSSSSLELWRRRRCVMTNSSRTSCDIIMLAMNIATFCQLELINSEKYLNSIYFKNVFLCILGEIKRFNVFSNYWNSTGPECRTPLGYSTAECRPEWIFHLCAHREMDTLSINRTFANATTSPGSQFSVPNRKDVAPWV